MMRPKSPAPAMNDRFSEAVPDEVAEAAEPEADLLAEAPALVAEAPERSAKHFYHGHHSPNVFEPEAPVPVAVAAAPVPVVVKKFELIQAC